MKSDRIVVALLTDGIVPYVVGGMQKHSRLIAENMALKDIEVILYHFLPKGVSLDSSQVLNSFSIEARPNISVRTFEYSDEGWFPGHYLRAQARLSQQYFDQLLKEERVDFIYAKGFTAIEVLKRRNSLPFECSVGVKFHGMNMFQKQPNLKGSLTKYMLRPTVRRIMRSADYVFSYGGKISEIISAEGIEEDKIIEIPAGISNDWVKNTIAAPSSSVRRFLYVGRFDRVKGLPELYKAIDRLTDIPFELEIVGPIPSEEKISNENVIYSGLLSGDDLIAAFDRNDVLLCPSISEGMPNVILEAMARGLSIIATDVGATGMLVSKKNGILIDAPNPKDIAESIKNAVSWSQSDLQAKKLKSIEIVKERFTWSQIGVQLAENMKRLST